MNLTWVDDASFNTQYHRLEDVYERFRSLLACEVLAGRQVAETYAWWAIAAGDELLVALALLECDSDAAPTSIDLSGVVREGAAVDEYDFEDDQPQPGRLEGRQLALGRLAPLSVRLFHIR